ncbi:MAG: hypothetical protein AB7P20_28890, partial [Rhizobiaceae bacterium]
MVLRSLHRALTRVGAGIAVLALAGCSQPDAQRPTAGPASSEVAAVEGASDRRLRLMTAEQYLNTLAYVFGPNVRPDVRFAPLQRT